MKRSESELYNAVRMTYSVKEDSDGLDMWYERQWLTSAYLDRQREVPGFKRSSAYKLEERSQQGLGRSIGDSSWKIRMASSVVQRTHLDAGWTKVKVNINDVIYHIISLHSQLIQNQPLPFWFLHAPLSAEQVWFDWVNHDQSTLILPRSFICFPCHFFF